MIKLTKEENIYLLKLNNKPVNALSEELTSELLILIKDISNDEESRGLLISTELKNFCAGADLKERSSMSDEKTVDTVYRIKKLFESIYKLPFPTVSSVKGACLGGGLEMALSCDFRFGFKDSFYGFPETSLGIIPGAGGTQLLPRLIGISKAKYLIYSANRVNVKDAFEMGLIDRIIDDDIESKSFEFLIELSSAYRFSISCAKESINAGIDRSLKSALNIEFKEYIKTLGSKDRQEALNKFTKT